MADNIKDYFIDRLRRKVRDYPTLNRLLKGNESESEDLEEALQSGLERFNTEFMPITNYTYESFPTNARIHLLKLAIIELLISNSILSTRNRLVYSDGKIGGIDTELKSGGYAEWATRLTQIWERRVQRYKQSQNLAQVGDGISSEYAGTSDEEEF